MKLSIILVIVLIAMNVLMCLLYFLKGRKKTREKK